MGWGTGRQGRFPGFWPVYNCKGEDALLGKGSLSLLVPISYRRGRALEKITLTLVKMVKKTLFSTVMIGVKTMAIGERDQAQLQIQQTQVEIYSQ